jgi:hypothetical protein
MDHEEQIELRDKMIAILAKALSKDPYQQLTFIRLAEDDARDEMNKSLFLVSGVPREDL